MSRQDQHPGHKIRKIALQVALQTQSRPPGLQSVLHQALSRPQLPIREKKLITELSYGYQRYRGRIEYICSRFLRKKQQLPLSFRTALGLAVYELLFVDSIPVYATLDVWVTLLKKRWGKRLSGVANALLREISRNQSAFDQLSFYQADHPNEITLLSRFYSCPPWLIRLLQDSLDTRRLKTVLYNSLLAPLVGVRLNRTRSEFPDLFRTLASHSFLAAKEWPGLAFAKSPPEIAQAEQKGLLSRQSLAAQSILSRLLPQSWPQPVWDACAGRGGKSGQLLEMGIKELRVSDRAFEKVLSCRTELQRLGFSKTPVLTADALSGLPFIKSPGTILLDVPCSGLGVLSRRPDIKWKRTQQDITQLLNIQRQMLRSSCEHCAAGGLVIYVTCTLNREENHLQISRVLRHDHLKTELIHEYMTPLDSSYREYFYAAVLRKGTTG